MSVRNLGFRDLQYLVATGRLGSVSRAASACAITQPALSERLKRIELTLGVELFERSKRRLSVTPVGERFLRKAQEVLDDVAELDELAASANSPLTGPLRVGLISTLGPYLMPLVLPALRKRYPGLELIIHEGLTEHLLAELHTGALDVLFASKPLDPTGLDQRPLFEETLVLAIPSSHEMADREEIAASDLHGEDMILLEDGHCLSGQALDVCPAKRRRNRDRLHAMTLETLRQMVASGAGYTLLPELAVGSKPPLGDLIRYTQLSGKRRYGRDIVMAWRKSYGRQEDIDLLAEIVLESLPKAVTRLS